jgi:hypothetical protein
MKLKIVLGKLAEDSRVINAETGEVLQGVRRVSLDYEINEHPVVKVELYTAEVEIEFAPKVN